jgi:hypothetical protein
MKIRKLTATTPRGTFTRNTHRIYSHIILCSGAQLRSVREQRAAENLDHDEKTLARYEAVIASGLCPSSHHSSITIKDFERYAAELREKIAEAPGRLAANIAYDEEAAATDRFWCYGWAGRPDLADKTARPLRSIYRAVEIYPVDAS